jgi:glucose-6-phosphate-specific signal transduction histidine kinase
MKENMSPNKPKNALRRSKAAHYFNSRAYALLLTILSITVVHYLTRQEAIFVHVVFRELYFIPIILGGFWFGLKGGLITALIVSVLYLPIAIGVPDKFSGDELGNVL